MYRNSVKLFRSNWEGYKNTWRRLTTHQKVSVSILILLLLVLPLGILLSISPITFLTGRAQYPTTAPTTPPLTVTPTSTLPLRMVFVQDSFAGTGQLDTLNWGWSGSIGSQASRVNDVLESSVSSGADNVGGKNVVAFPYFNGEIKYLVGDFEAYVDLLGVDSDSGWQELKFSAVGSISIRRNKTGVDETLEVWTSPNNTSTDAVMNVSRIFPKDLPLLRVKLAREGNELLAYYYDGSTFINIFNITYNALLGEGFVPSLVTENDYPTYPTTKGVFDNYYLKANVVADPIPTPTIIVPSVTRYPTNPMTPTPFNTPTVVPTISIFPVSPTPTLAPMPPTGNLAPKISMSKFKFLRVGKYLEVDVKATDRNGDVMVMDFSNLPPGLVFGDCKADFDKNGASTLSCLVKGTPSQSGFYTSNLLVRDQWGVDSNKIVYFTVMP